MDRPFSVYLDLVRFTAACLVYLWHSNRRLLVEDILPLAHYGHSAVIVFFVLSGFVIAYVTDTKEKTWVDYGASRLSRVFSVVLPTLILTPLLDVVGRGLYPALYEGDFPFDRFVARVLGCGLLLNEAWFISITYFSNVPYWSIAFEFWYYMAFAIVTFAPQRWRAAAVLALCAMLGPKFVLLLPVWWAGVVLYRWRWPKTWSVGMSWAMLIVTTAGIVLTHAVEVYQMADAFVRDRIGAELTRELTFARHAFGDYLLASLVFCQFAAMRNLSGQWAPLLLAIERPVRWLAGYTFTLYLLHQPLLLFWAAVLRGDPSGHGYWAFVTAATAVSVVLIGMFTEQRRDGLRRLCRQWLQRLSDRRLGGLRRAN